MAQLVSLEDHNSTTPTQRTAPLLRPPESRVFGGRYRVRRLLGRGGMAEVFLADDLLLERAVAIKVMHSSLADDPAGLERFRREAMTLAAVRSKHVVDIYDIGLEHDGVYLVMQHVDGQTLEQEILCSGPMAQTRAESVLTQLLDGLAEMHSQGLVHRDIKPSNILLDGATNHVVLLDLGIVLDTRRAPLTEPGMIAGTPGYLAPESRFCAETEFASDVYQVGLLMLFLLTGVDYARRWPMKDFQDLVDLLPSALGVVARRALANDPAARFPSAALMKEALAMALESPRRAARVGAEPWPSRSQGSCDATKLSAIQLINLLTDAMPTAAPAAAPPHKPATTALQASPIIAVAPTEDPLAFAFSTSRPTKTWISTVPGPELRLKILLVDEEAAFCTMLHRILSSTYDVVVAHSAAPAVTYLEGTNADVILCGLGAPMALHAPLRDLRPELAAAIIFLSSRSTSKEARTYIARLPNPCLGKPFEATLLKKMIDQRLAPTTTIPSLRI